MNRAVLVLIVAGFTTLADTMEPQAPPPAITIERPAAPVANVEVARPARTATTTLYSIGEPTDDEQLYLELINRTRADALAEALRLANTTDPELLAAYQFFSVDRQVFVNDTAGYPRAQPLSFEPRITAAARGHSAWMLANGIQAHDQTDPPGSMNVVKNLGNRLDEAGYPLSAAGESIFAFAKNPEHGHAGFEVDWGNGPSGMQSPPGHRINNHNLAYREVGIGVLNGSGPNGAGPQVVTINFGSRLQLAPLVTGVAYFDLNGNQFYDKGEGIGGLTVNVTGSGSHAVTAGSGGYTVPSGNGQRTVTFGGAGLSPTNLTVNLDGENVKVDLRLAYSPPTVTGGASPKVGNPNLFSFSPIPGGTSYSWEVSQLQAWSGVEGAEAGATNVTFKTTGNYTPFSNSRKSGLVAFHLVNQTNTPATDQFFTLKTQVRPRSGAQLVFWKKLGFASDTQTGVAQVSADGGLSWEKVWSQTGKTLATNTTLIELAFSQRTVDLGAYVGKNIQLRFGYLYGSGPYYPGNSKDHGLSVDDISLTATDMLVGTTTRPVTGVNEFVFVPPVVGTYLLTVQPKAGNNTFPASSALSVSAVAAPANVAPVFTGLLDRTVTELTPLAFALTATDSNAPAQPLTFSLVSGPAGLTVASGGAVNWTPTEPDGPGTNTVTVQVSDGALSDAKSFKVVVTEANQPPVLAPVTDQQVDELATLSLQLAGSDPDLPAQPLTYSLVSGPAGFGVSASGLATWTPDALQGPATLPVAVRVSDGQAQAERTFQVTVKDTAGVLVTLSASKLTLGPSGKLRLDFSLTQGLPTGFTLERSPSLASLAWQPVAGAKLATNSPGNFSFRFDPSGEAGFYRVNAQ